jgi:hypothetical protein
LILLTFSKPMPAGKTYHFLTVIQEIKFLLQIKLQTSNEV